MDQGAFYTGFIGSACTAQPYLCVSTDIEVTPLTRGLNSSTFRLNVSAFCGIEGALRDLFRVILRVFKRCRGVMGGDGGCRGEFRVYVVSDTAHVELRSG